MRVGVNPLIQLGYLHQATGINFDERYWNDPVYRVPLDRVLAQASLAVIPPDFRSPSAGDSKPGPFMIGTAQSFLVIPGMFGARFLYYDDFPPSAENRPLEGWTLDEIARLKPPDVARAWPLAEYLRVYDALAATYGPDRVSITGFIFSAPIHGHGTFQWAGIHSPVTIAYRMRGPQLFYDMADDPKTTWHLLDVIVETMCRCIDLIAAKMQVVPEVIYQACCISALFSRRTFEEWELPAMLKVFRRYGVKARIHSCGSSTHLLPGLAQIPGLIEVELGEGTDMAKARQLWPEASLIYIPDSPKLAWRQVAAVKADIRRVIAEAASGPFAIQNILEEPMGIPQFHAVYDVVREHNAREGV